MAVSAAGHSVFGRVYGGEVTTPEKDGIKYCAVSSEGMQELQKAVSLKKLPDDVCVSKSEIDKGNFIDISAIGDGLNVVFAFSTFSRLNKSVCHVALI